MTLRTEDHEFEAEHGLPQPLPVDERMVWQGSPHWADLATSLFHLDLVALWFAALCGWRVLQLEHDGGTWTQAIHAIAPLATMGLLAIGLFAGLAWGVSRTTVYTLTDRRFVLRIGIVLSLTLNLPLARIDAVDLRTRRGGAGDLALRLNRADRVAYGHLWPHARPWQVRRPEPMLRGIADAAELAQRLRTVLAGAGASAAAAPADQPSRVRAGSAGVQPVAAA